MSLFFVIFSIFILILLGLFIYTNGGSLSLGSVEFITKGREAGLNPKDIKTLKKTAEVLNLEKPLLLLGSLSHVDNAIGLINQNLETYGYVDISLVNLLEDLYSYRKSIELNKRERIHSIKSSREIELNQQVKVTCGAMENPFIGYVIENSPENLIIDFSKDHSFAPGTTCDGPINIYFWKNSDAGYYFETIVLESNASCKWKVSHSNSLIRSQKRLEVRIDLDVNGYIYQLDNISKRNSRPEGLCGTLAQFKNLSEGGAALLINGRIEKGLPIKMEFQLLEKLVVICGIVKNSNYNKKSNISFVRIKFIEPAIEMLTNIRSFIYNINKEQEMLMDNNKFKAVESSVEINNNQNNDDFELEEISEVEYLPEENSVLV